MSEGRLVVLNLQKALFVVTFLYYRRPQGQAVTPTPHLRSAHDMALGGKRAFALFSTPQSCSSPHASRASRCHAPPHARGCVFTLYLVCSYNMASAAGAGPTLLALRPWPALRLTPSQTPSPDGVCDVEEGLLGTLWCVEEGLLGTLTSIYTHLEIHMKKRMHS